VVKPIIFVDFPYISLAGYLSIMAPFPAVGRLGRALRWGCTARMYCDEINETMVSLR
jgi:hypothetical protein